MIAAIAIIFGVLALVLFPIVYIVFYTIGTIIGLLIRYARWAIRRTRKSQDPLWTVTKCN